MEFFKSFGLLLLGILKRLYYLIPSLFTDPFDFLERWFKVIYEPPQWLFWLLLSLGLAIAISKTYHELRVQTGGYKLLAETKRLLRDFRQQALELEKDPTLTMTEVKAWINQTAHFIELALGSARRKDFLRIAEAEGRNLDLNIIPHIQGYLNRHSCWVGDLADRLGETDMRQNFKSKDLDSIRKQFFGKKDSQT